MVDFRDLCTNKTKENEGVWVKCTGLFDVISIKVCRAGNKKVLEMYQSLMAPYKKYDLPHAVIPPHILEEKTQVLIRIYAEAIFKDVRVDIPGEIFTIDGKKWDNTIETAIKFLQDNDFFNQVLSASNVLENFRGQEIEDNVKNSRKASSGK